MSPRMTIATCAAAIAIVTVSGCGSSDDKAKEPVKSTTKPATVAPDSGAKGDPPRSSPSADKSKPTTLPSVDSSSDGAIAIRGQWANDKARWTVEFHEDGSFSEELGDTESFRSGRYEVKGNVVRTYGIDGSTTTGTVRGDKIYFKRGTVRRL